MKRPNLNFKTKFLEILEIKPNEILTNEEYQKTRIDKISKIIQNNPDKLCLLVLKGTKGMKIPKETNITFIKFQIACGFKLIKVFFKNSRNALQNSKEYRTLIPNDRTLVIVLDEKLVHTTFKTLYLDAYGKHGDEIIGFLGREPSKTNRNNKLNLQFISSRENDKIIRLVSSTRRTINIVVSSLIYHLFGFDIYSFSTRLGPPNVPITDLKILNGFTYELLTSDTKLTCVATGMNIFTSSRRFALANKSSVPVSVHDIVRLNEQFEDIQETHTRQDLLVIAGSRMF